jgi:hypothetical protein
LRRPARAAFLICPDFCEVFAVFDKIRTEKPVKTQEVSWFPL